MTDSILGVILQKDSARARRVCVRKEHKMNKRIAVLLSVLLCVSGVAFVTYYVAYQPVVGQPFKFNVKSVTLDGQPIMESEIRDELLRQGAMISPNGVSLSCRRQEVEDSDGFRIYLECAEIDSPNLLKVWAYADESGSENYPKIRTIAVKNLVARIKWQVQWREQCDTQLAHMPMNRVR